MIKIAAGLISSLLIILGAMGCTPEVNLPPATATTTSATVTNPPPTTTPVLVFAELAAAGEAYTWQNSLGNWKPATAVIDGVVKTLDSTYFESNTFLTMDQFGRVELNFTWDTEGARISEAVTTRLIGQRLGIFKGGQALLGDDGQPFAPVIQAVITSRGVITGLSVTEAQQLYEQLNAGRPPAATSTTANGP